MAKYSGSGWHKQSVRHSNARKYGKAGGKYAVYKKDKYGLNAEKVGNFNKKAFLVFDKNKFNIIPLTQKGIDKAQWNEIVRRDEMKTELANKEQEDYAKALKLYKKTRTKKHYGSITRVKSQLSLDIVARHMEEDLRKLGYDVSVTAQGKKLHMSHIRLGEGKLEKEGYNISPYTGRRGRILSWNNWVEVNNQMNKTLDELGVSANINSLGGKFKIREGTHSFGEETWDRYADENIGSMMNPVSRREGWQSEGKPTKIRKHYGKPEPEISTIYGKGKYSHTEDDKEFYSHKGDPYSYKNGYAVIHTGNEHRIYKLE